MPKVPKITGLHYLRSDMLEFILIFGICIDIQAMGIISFICKSKAISNDYLHVKNESRTLWSSNNALSFYLILFFYIINPLSANPTKWSNTLKQFVGNSRRIV